MYLVFLQSRVSEASLSPSTSLSVCVGGVCGRRVLGSIGRIIQPFAAQDGVIDKSVVGVVDIPRTSLMTPVVARSFLCAVNPKDTLTSTRLTLLFDLL